MVDPFMATGTGADIAALDVAISLACVLRGKPVDPLLMSHDHDARHLRAPIMQWSA